MTDLNPHMCYFVRKTCTPQWSLTPTELDFYDLTFVLKGKSVYYTRHGAHILHPGEAIFIRSGDSRAAETTGMECAAFSFRLEGELPWDSGILSWKQDEQLLHWFRDYEQHWFSLDGDRNLFCRGLFLLILHRMLELNRPEPENPYVPKIRRYLEAHFLEKVTVAQVADYLGLHPTYCGALFRRETGKTILQTVNLLRINQAAELLRYGGARVTDTALACGFSDIFYFSRVFKAVTGRSPEAFIRECDPRP